MTKPSSRKLRFIHVITLTTIALLVWFLLFHAQPERLPYSLYVELVSTGKVRTASVSRSMITGRFDREGARETLEAWRVREREALGATPPEAPATPETPPTPGTPPERREEPPPFSGASERSYPYVVLRGALEHDDAYLRDLLDRYDVAWEQEAESNALSYLLPILMMLTLFGLIWIFLVRRTDAFGQQVLTFGKSRAKIVAVEDTKTSFDDVAGCQEAKEELSEVVDFLRDPERFQRLGGQVPHGLLLIGPPGTGKTLIARAVAGEADVPFFSISGSDFVEMFVGVGAARVRDLFQQAKLKAPCIVFIDEIDAVGRQRGAGLGGGNDEREQTLNQLLSEMDGFEPNQGVIVLAATNRPDVLDPALLRPGRFDRQVVIDNADVRGREQILRVHARNKPLAEDVDLHQIARRTPGFSGADLANVMNEAALLAARRNKDVIARAELEEAAERVMAGPERRSRVIRPHEKEIIAHHETGHALVSYFVERADRVHKISIVPRGPHALGYTLQIPAEDRYILQRAELVDRMCVALGGRVAEEIIYGESSTGAADDLEKVTDLARSMICRWGMSTELGPIIYQRSEPQVFLGRELSEERHRFADSTLDAIDHAVKELVESCYTRTRRILTENRELLEKLAAELIDREVMEGYEFAEIIRSELGAKAPPAATEQVRTPTSTAPAPNPAAPPAQA